MHAEVVGVERTKAAADAGAILHGKKTDSGVLLREVLKDTLVGREGSQQDQTPAELDIFPSFMTLTSKIVV